MTVNRDDLIDDALIKINGDRQEEYGDVYNSFTTISLGWDIITKNARHAWVCKPNACWSDDGLAEDEPAVGEHKP